MRTERDTARKNFKAELIFSRPEMAKVIIADTGTAFDRSRFKSQIISRGHITLFPALARH
jgi:hypothetical protein